MHVVPSHCRHTAPNLPAHRSHAFTRRHAHDLAKWEAAVAEAKQQQAVAQAAAQDAQRAQQLAESSRSLLAELERALDAREAKLQDSWRALAAQTSHLQQGGGGGDAPSSAAALLHSSQRLKVGQASWAAGSWRTIRTLRQLLTCPAACSLLPAAPGRCPRCGR